MLPDAARALLDESGVLQAMADACSGVPESLDLRHHGAASLAAVTEFVRLVMCRRLGRDRWPCFEWSRVPDVIELADLLDIKRQHKLVGAPNEGAWPPDEEILLRLLDLVRRMPWLGASQVLANAVLHHRQPPNPRLGQAAIGALQACVEASPGSSIMESASAVVQLLKRKPTRVVALAAAVVTRIEYELWHGIVKKTLEVWENETLDNVLATVVSVGRPRFDDGAAALLYACRCTEHPMLRRLHLAAAACLRRLPSPSRDRLAKLFGNGSLLCAAVRWPKLLPCVLLASPGCSTFLENVSPEWLADAVLLEHDRQRNFSSRVPGTGEGLPALLRIKSIPVGTWLEAVLDHHLEISRLLSYTTTCIVRALLDEPRVRAHHGACTALADRILRCVTDHDMDCDWPRVGDYPNLFSKVDVLVELAVNAALPELDMDQVVEWGFRTSQCAARLRSARLAVLAARLVTTAET